MQLVNGEFTTAWDGDHDVLVVPSLEVIQVGNIFTPFGWGCWFANNYPYAQPEGTDAWSKDPVPRFISPPKGYVLFNFNKVGRHGLYQQIHNVEVGRKIRFRTQAHMWSNHKEIVDGQVVFDNFPHPDLPEWSEGAGLEAVAWRRGSQPTTGDPQQDAKSNGTFQVGIDVTGGTDPNGQSVLWGDAYHIYNGFGELEVRGVAQNETVTLFTRCTTKYPFKHNDTYYDNAIFDYIDVVPPPAAGHDGPVARVDFVQKINVYDPNEGREAYLEVCARVWDEKGPEHIGPSSDAPHLGCGVGLKLGRWWHVLEQDIASYELFHEKYYPDSGMVSEYMPWGTKPPTSPGPPVCGWLGVHQLQNQPNGLADWMAQGMALGKAVDRIDQIIAMWNMTPDNSKPFLRLFFRRYHPDEGSYRYDPSKAKWWINYVCSDLTDQIVPAGVPTNQVWVLGLNEVWDHSWANNMATLAFEHAAIIALEKWNRAHGTQYKYAGSSAAVGNPQRADEGGGEALWLKILDLAKRFNDFPYNDDKGQCAFTYHSYGICKREHPEWLQEWSQWLQDRWMVNYEWLVDRGEPTPFWSGEGGHVVGSVTGAYNVRAHSAALIANRQTVLVPSQGVRLILNKRRELYNPNRHNLNAMGMWLNPGHGWVGEISADRAVAELVKYFNNPLELFNAQYNWEAHYGNTTFQWGNRTDWRYFNHEALLQPLLAALIAEYGRMH